MQSSYPASSNIFLTFFDKYAKSPLSSLTAFGLYPFGFRTSLNTLIAFGSPDSIVLYVSIKNVQSSGYNSAYALKASYSESKLWIQLCAIVPLAGTLNSFADNVHDVPTAPPIIAALAPSTAALIPCALLAPNSITGLPCASFTILLVFVAIKDWWLVVSNSIVSNNCACIIGAFTVINGSFGNTTVPSGIAHISPVNLKFSRSFKNSSENLFCFLR